MDLKVLVIGALGRCGGGAVAMATDLGLPLENITRWDVAETRAGGPFPEMVTDYDILVNVSCGVSCPWWQGRNRKA